MKKIFTLAMAAAAVVGASAAPLSFKNAPQIKLTEVKELTAVSPKATSVISRAGETMAPELTGGEYVAQFAMEFSDGFFSAAAQTAKITKDGEGYTLNLGLDNMFQGNLTPKDVKLVKMPMEMQDGSTVDYWGIPTDGSQVVFEGVELTNGNVVDVYVAGCAVADADATSGTYGFVGASPQTAPIFECSANGDFLKLIQYNWQGTQAPVTGLFLGADIDGKTYSIGLDMYDLAYYQTNASYTTTAEGQDGDEVLEGACYVLPVQYQIGSGYEAYGVADCGGALLSIIDGSDATCYPNPALYYEGMALYWGDSMNSSDNFVAKGSYAENGDAKTITYPELGWILGNGSEIGFFKDTTITFGGTGAINDVAVDNNNAPVEYFNLQGVRVNEPVAGQIVIRRQGNEVSKLLVK